MNIDGEFPVCQPSWREPEGEREKSEHTKKSKSFSPNLLRIKGF
jgi:hypothetical protein